MRSMGKFLFSIKFNTSIKFKFLLSSKKLSMKSLVSDMHTVLFNITVVPDISCDNRQFLRELT